MNDKNDLNVTKTIEYFRLKTETKSEIAVKNNTALMTHH